jgi:hypothetical protein
MNLKNSSLKADWILFGGFYIFCVVIMGFFNGTLWILSMVLPAVILVQLSKILKLRVKNSIFRAGMILMISGILVFTFKILLDSWHGLGWQFVVTFAVFLFVFAFVAFVVTLFEPLFKKIGTLNPNNISDNEKP